MTRKERQTILEACEYIETGHNMYSCCAIADIEGVSTSHSKLVSRYGEFYEKNQHDVWLSFDDTLEGFALDEVRVLMLLMFMEAEKYVISKR